MWSIDFSHFSSVPAKLHTYEINVWDGRNCALMRLDVYLLGETAQPKSFRELLVLFGIDAHN